MQIDLEIVDLSTQFRPRRQLVVHGRDSAGTGLTLAGAVFSADPGYLQRRVSSSCEAGNADFFQHGFCVVLDDLQRFLVQDLEIRDIALDELCRLERDRRPFRPTRRPATTKISRFLNRSSVVLACGPSGPFTRKVT